MPLGEDVPPGRAAQLAEELGRVTVVSARRVGYAVRVERRHVVRHAVVGGAVGWWVSGPFAFLVPPPDRVAVVLVGLALGASLWALRFPPMAVAWAQVDRFTPDDDVGGSVAWVGVRSRAELPAAVDRLVALARSGDLDALEEVVGAGRVALRWRSSSEHVPAVGRD